MSWRSELEDQYTVRCKSCGHEQLDTSKSPGQKYIQGACPKCLEIHPKPRAVAANTLAWKWAEYTVPSLVRELASRIKSLHSPSSLAAATAELTRRLNAYLDGAL